MVPQDSFQGSLVVQLWQLIDRLPVTSSVLSRRAGRSKEYSDRLFLKALVLMIVKHLHRVNEFLQVLEQPTLEMQKLHHLLEEKGRYPSRRTFERRLAALPDTLPAQIGCLGRHLIEILSLVAKWSRGCDGQHGFTRQRWGRLA